MKKACFVLFGIIATCAPSPLFAGVTMVTHTTRTSTRCDYRDDKCETTVANDPSYVHFKDGTNSGPGGIDSANGDSGSYRGNGTFQDYSTPLQTETVDSLLALIRSKLSNCPEIELTMDEDTGELTIRYAKNHGGCVWTINVRDIKEKDFIWKRTEDNYSPRLGQLESRKFHTRNEKDAQDIEAAVQRICAIQNWTMTKE